MIHRTKAFDRLSIVLTGAALLLAVSGCTGGTLSSISGSEPRELDMPKATATASPSPSLTVAEQTAARWTTTGSMITPRILHTATVLPNGKVLVAGGYGIGGEVLRSAELYDPISRTWIATGDLIDARTYHTAALLPDGRVLVAGGYGMADRVLASAELYDPISGSWTSAQGLHEGRSYHTATLLPDGTVLVAGGGRSSSGSDALASAELYDAAAGAWLATGTMVERRSYHAATLLPDGTVMVVGGVAGIDGLTSAELYDHRSKSWIATGSLTEARSYPTATLMTDGTVLVAGGHGGRSGAEASGPLASAELYDPDSESWMTIGSMSDVRAVHTATMLPDGSVLVTGGISGNHIHSLGILASAEVYDPISRSWTVSPSMAELRVGHTASLLHDGTVLVAGGSGTGLSAAVTPAELFDPKVTNDRRRPQN